MADAVNGVARADRLRCVLAMGAEEIAEVDRRGVSAVDTRAIAARVGTSPSRVLELLATPHALEACRLDPNTVSLAQLRNIPGLHPARLRAVESSRPFFTIDELEVATRVDKAVLDQLFELPGLAFTDKSTGTRVPLEPVPFQYVIPPRDEFEGAEMIATLGFGERAGPTAARVRAVFRSELEHAESGDLKSHFRGAIVPVLRDRDGNHRYFVPGFLDVWVEPDTVGEAVRALADGCGLDVVESRPKHGWYRARVRPDLSAGGVLERTLGAIAELNRHAEVLFAEPDEVSVDDFGPQQVTEVTQFEDTSALSRTWNLDVIELEAANAAATAGGEVVVLVVDSGMRLDHPDLEPALHAQWASLDLNFVSGLPESEASPHELGIAHGTQVAGVAVGRSMTGGARGVAARASVLPVKISGTPFGDSYALRALAIREAADYVPASSRAVLNVSWSTSGEHLGIREAIIYATSKGIAVVASAGNYQPGALQIPDKPHYPSAYALPPDSTPGDVTAHRYISGVCSVAAVSSSLSKASYSYFGGSSVSFAAPGGEAGGQGSGIFVASTPSNYVYAYGTSFAAPHAAGLLALLLSQRPTLTAQEAINLVRATATDLDARNPQHAGLLGGGLINARTAVESLLAGGPSDGHVPTTETPVVEPTQTSPGPLDLNAASHDDLVGLPLVGPWTASRIITYRQVHGPFSGVDELLSSGLVDGWTLAQIAHLLTVGPATPPVSPTPLDSPPTATTPPGGNDAVNVNSACAATLARLPLIGPWSAERIVDDRSRHGPFRVPRDLVDRGLMDDWTLRIVSPRIRI